jgi:hypothetical protein
MQELKRVHYHHADSVALGGRIERPFDQLIPTKNSLSLSPSGGHASKSSRGFKYRGFISYAAAHTQVSGSSIHKDGPWTTMVTTTVEGLNVLDLVTADRVVARVSTEHPAEGYHPRISFTGTHFENLKVAGCEVKVDLNLDMCQQGNSGTFPQESCLQDGGFMERVNQQRKAFADEKKKQESLGNKISDLVLRHASDYSDRRHEKSGHVLCSLVNQITVDESHRQCPGERLGHVITVPDFGKIFLAELLVSHGQYELIMLRFELGCPVVGNTTVVTARINGKTEP